MNIISGNIYLLFSILFVEPYHEGHFLPIVNMQVSLMGVLQGARVLHHVSLVLYHGTPGKAGITYPLPLAHYKN